MSRRASKRFLEACGVPRGLKLEVEGPAGVEVRTFGRPFVVVGRDPGTGLTLDDPAVSRRHAYLQVIDGHLFCVDLNSRTGVGWAEGPRWAGWVDPADGVRIGPFRVRPVDVGPTAPSEDATPLRGRPGGRLARAVLEFPQKPTRPPAQLSRVLSLLGRDRRCWLRLAGTTVSRLHCALIRTPGGVWAVDLLGRGGISVSGRRVRAARLRHGDDLQLGSFVVQISTRATRAGMYRGPGPGVTALPATWDGARTDPAVFPAWFFPQPPVPAQDGSGARPPVFASADPGQMQLMLEQFQQNMMMMAQMFAALHRDQAGVIREELARLHTLNQTLAELQAQQIGRSAEPVPPRPADGDAAIVEALARIEALLRVRDSPAAPALPAGGATVPPPTPPVPAQADRPVRAAGNGTPPRPAPRVPAGDPPVTDLHLLLSRRIAELHEEREGRWQRILKFMLGT